VARGGTSTVRWPVLRLPGTADAPRRALLRAIAAVCAGVCVLALVVAALVVAYVAYRTAAEIVAGRGDAAARWATLVFAAGVPIVVAYAAHSAYSGAVARLRGEARAAIGVWAIAAPAAVIALAVAIQGALSAGSYFVTDDWLHIAIAHDAVTGGGLDVGYLGRTVFIHYAPGHRFAYWALDQLAPLDWSAALSVMLALFAGALAVFHRICVRLFGRRPSNLVLLGLFGTSVLLVPSFLWFADAVHKFPSMLLSLIAIDAYLAYRLEGRKRALAVAVAAVGLGSLFYVKALLVPLYLLLIRALFLEKRPGRALRAIAEERWTWLAFAPVYVIYGINYFMSYSTVQHSAPSLHFLAKYLWLAWFRGVTPAFAGVHVAIDAKSPELLMAFGAQALLIAVIALSVWRKRSAWRAWVFWGVAFGANAVVIALGRLGSLGLKQVGSQLRYDTEMTWLLPLALGFAFFPGEVAARTVAGEPVRRVRWPSQRLRVALVVLAACAYLAASIDTGRDTATEWRRLDSDQPKAYVENMQRDAARLERAGSSLQVLDDQTPAYLIAPPHKPWNRLERLIPAIAPELKVVPAGPNLLQARQDGNVIPIQLQGLATGPSSITGAGTVSLSGGRRVRRGGHPCAVAGSAPAALSFATETLLRGESLFARLDYRVLRQGSGPVLVTADSYRGRTQQFAIAATHGSAYLNLGHAMRATLPPGSELCLSGASVGWIAP
jgi:hypothetical protein